MTGTAPVASAGSTSVAGKSTVIAGSAPLSACARSCLATTRNDNLAVVPELVRINENLSRFADGKSIRYIDINHKLADSTGKLCDGMTVDGLHPTLKGYQLWADALKPIFTELLGPPASTDQALPPTGDPSARR